MTDIKLAACVLIQKDDNTVLAVSRKTDKTSWGLPGGKVELGETPLRGAIRELKEETGIQLEPTDLEEVFSKLGHSMYVKTFLCKKKGDFKEAHSSEEGFVGWADKELLMNGPFGEYNTALFAYLDAKGILTGQSRDA